MPVPPQDLRVLFRRVLQDLASGIAPDQIITTRFLEARTLQVEDRAHFFRLAVDACGARSETAGELADDLTDLADHLVVSLSSDRRARIECALGLYEAARTVYDAEEAPADRAYVEARVAVALTHRLRAPRAENLLRAEAAARQAVALATLGDPWIEAEAHAVLGSVLLEQPSAQDEARTAFLAAAEHYLAASDRSGWAEASLDAVVALTERGPSGDLSDWADALAEAADLCAAVVAHSPALPSRFRADAALAAAKVALARGGAEPIDHAVLLLEEALDAPPDDLHFADEAKLHVNLGVAYGRRLRGDPEENLERAVQAFRTARTLFEPHLPFDAALCDLNLAAAYGERIRGLSRENIRDAITAARRARSYFEACDDHTLWRTASLTLASLLVRQPPVSSPSAQDSSEGNVEEGLALLRTLIDASVPALDRASAMVALADALCSKTARPSPEVAQTDTQALQCEALLREAAGLFETHGRLERWGAALCDLAALVPPTRAATLYRRILERVGQSAHPDERAHLSLQLRAASALAALDLDDAFLASQQAVAAVLELANLAPDDPYRAHELAERAWPVVAAHVQRATQTGQSDEAHQSVLHDHGLHLMAGLGSRSFSAAYPTRGAMRHEVLRRSLTDGYRLRDELRPARGRLAPSEPGVRSDLALEWEATLAGGGRTSLTPLHPQAGEVVLTTYTGPDGLWTRLDWEGGSDGGHWHGPDAAAALTALAQTVTAPAASCPWGRALWEPRLAERLQDASTLLRLDRLLAACPPTARRLVVRPHRAFHAVPFAALLSGRAFLADRFPDSITVLPLPLASPEATLPLLDRPLRLVLPPGTAPELAGLALDLGGVNPAIVPPDQLAVEAGKATLLHLATHAEVQASDPLAARLDAGTASLPSPYRLDLRACALVTLAACSAASANLDAVGANVVGLPAAFLLAGARHVIAAQWPVSDAAAAVLLGRFYTGVVSGQAVAPAFSAAQAWTRNATRAEILDWVGPGNDDARALLRSSLAEGEGKGRPFELVADWAAFALYTPRTVDVSEVLQ